MLIESAVIHSYDQKENARIFGEKTLNLMHHPELEALLIKMFKSFQNTALASKLKFNENSSHLLLLENDFKFMAQSERDAKDFFNYYQNEYANKNINLIFALIHQEEESYYCMFELHAKRGLIKTSQEDLSPSLIFPDTFASSKSAFMINLNENDGKVKVYEKHQAWFKENFDCELIPNAKRSYQVIKEVSAQITDERNEDPLLQDIKTKETLNHISSSFDEISVLDFLEESLGGLDEKENEIVKNRFEIEQMEDLLDLQSLRKSRISNRLHMISEYGVEIIIPLDQLDPEVVLDIREDGTDQVIELKHIGKIISK